jgi:hypothetical protein
VSNEWAVGNNAFGSEGVAEPLPSGDARGTRLSLRLNTEAAAFVSDVTARRDITITEAIRRALAIYKLIEDAQQAGHHVQIDDGRTVRSLMLI